MNCATAVQLGLGTIEVDGLAGQPPREREVQDAGERRARLVEQAAADEDAFDGRRRELPVGLGDQVRLEPLQERVGGDPRLQRSLARGIKQQPRMLGRHGREPRGHVRARYDRGLLTRHGCERRQEECDRQDVPGTVDHHVRITAQRAPRVNADTSACCAVTSRGALCRTGPAPRALSPPVRAGRRAWAGSGCRD